MNKSVVVSGALSLIALLAWQGYRLAATPDELPLATATTEPATQYQQAWRSWEEQVADIKKQYGLQQTSIESLENVAATYEEPAQVLEQASAVADTQAVSEPPIADAQSPLLADANAPAVSKGFERDAQAFWNEPVDEIWAQQSSQQISDYFAGLEPRDGLMSVLNDVECRTNRCKVEVVHDDQQAVEDFELAFPIRMAGQLHGITYQTDERLDGRIAVVMYLSK